MRTLMVLDSEAVVGPCADVPVPAAARPQRLVRGAVHPAVRDAQRRLNAFHAAEVAAGRPGLATAPLVEDCVFGKMTQQALIAFQQKVFPGVTAEHDGRLGPKTWAEFDRVAGPPGPGPLPVTPPPAASGDFAAFLSGELVDSIPRVGGSAADPHDQHNQYVLPTASQLVAWRAVFQNLLAGAREPAHRLARMISSTYNVVEFLDTPTRRTFYVLMEGVPGLIPPPADHRSVSVCITDPANPTRRGWGTYVFAAQPQRALSLSAPHPHADTYTGLQAVEAFLQLRAHTLLIAGADRDQNTADSPCDQSTPSRPFREADVSHTADSVFQIAFEEIYSTDTSTWHLQFHGNANCNVDVFLSNGVAEDVPPKLDDLCTNIEHESEAAAAGGCKLKVDVYDHEQGDCSLRGTTNMQMRFASSRSHGSICDNNPQGPSRFIHIEQRRAARSAPGDEEFTPGRNRGVVLAGISKTFPSDDFVSRSASLPGTPTHPRDLAIALRDHGCLAWGAVDFGPSFEGSGDMMHFDARVDGVGRVLTVNTKASVPEPGHHPCAPVPATPAGKEEEEAEQTLPTIPATQVRDLIRELKARNMPVAHGDAILVLERLDALRQVVTGKVNDRPAVIAAVEGFLQAVDAHPLSAAHQSLIGATVGDSIAARLVVNGFTGEADRILGHFHSPTSEYGPWYRGTQTSFVAKGSGYFPDASAIEGGFRDRLGQPLHTLQDFCARQAPFVSVAMDADNGPPYGTRLSIDEFPGVVFRIVDTGAAFRGKGLSRIDICTANKKASLDPTINGLLHLNFAISLPAPQTRPQETTEESALGFSPDDDSDDDAEAPSACPPRRLPGEITRSRAPGGVLPIDVVEGAHMLTVHDFAVGSDALPPGVTTAPGWQRVMSQLAGDPTSLVGVTGFTDCVGADAENASLRKRRALAIVAAMPPLVQQRVIPGHPITTDFLDVNSTVEGRARNRAVTLKLALDNLDEPAISKASNLDEFLYLVRVLERKLKLTSPADAPKVLSVLRQIYYGSPLWSCSRNAMWDNVIRKRIWLPTADPTPLLGSKLVTAFKMSLSVEGVAPGHVLTGLDAMMAPGFVAIPAPAAYQDVPNEAWATWAGDLASAAADWVADQFWNTLKGTGDLASYIHDLAADDDLTGDVDAFALRAGLNGTAGPAQLASVVRLSGRLSSMLLDYYRVTASPLGQARERRMRNFISAHGGSVVGGHLQRRAQLEAALRPTVRYMARLFFAADLQKPKRSGQPPKPPPRFNEYWELESASDSVTLYFVDWLFTRAVAEPGP